MRGEKRTCAYTIHREAARLHTPRRVTSRNRSTIDTKVGGGTPLFETTSRAPTHASACTRIYELRKERAANDRSHLNRTCRRVRLPVPVCVCPVSSRQKGGPSTESSPLPGPRFLPPDEWPTIDNLRRLCLYLPLNICVCRFIAISAFLFFPYCYRC